MVTPRSWQNDTSPNTPQDSTGARTAMLPKISYRDARKAAFVTLCVCLVALGVATHAQAQLSITDGDTIKIDGETIRIMGVDTPETFRAKCPAEKYLGLRAKHRLQQLLVSDEVTIERHGKDKYRRTLARVFVNGQDVAHVLIGEGLGREYHGRTKRRSWC